MNNFIPAMSYVDNKRDQVYKNVEKTGKYDNKLKIGNETDFEQFSCDANKLPDYQINLIKAIDNIFNIVENYYVITYKDKNYKCDYGTLLFYNKKK